VSSEAHLGPVAATDGHDHEHDDDDADPETALVEGLGGQELRAIASLWQRTGREVLARFGGSSMEPTIPPGAEVLLRCGGAPCRGDVIAFVRDDRVILHRVVGLSAREDWVLTRGDAHALPDVPLRNPEDFVGRVSAVRKGGELLPVPPPPRSPARWLALCCSLPLLRVAPRLAAFEIRALLAFRRWLIYVPRHLFQRTFGRRS